MCLQVAVLLGSRNIAKRKLETEMTRKRRVPIGAIVSATLLGILVLSIGTWVVMGEVSVTGRAFLSNGMELKVVATTGVLDRGCTIASTDETTTIESGQYLVAFERGDIVVNGSRIGKVPDGSHYVLYVDSSEGVEFRMRGKIIAKCD